MKRQGEDGGVQPQPRNAAASTSWERQGGTPELLWEWTPLTGRRAQTPVLAPTHLSHHLLPLPSQGLKVHLLRGWTGQLLEA